MRSAFNICSGSKGWASACSWVAGATPMSAAVGVEGVEGEEGAALPVLSPLLHA